jgi:death on curing protein
VPASVANCSTRISLRCPLRIFFHIARNHAFIDGNKRTALACCLVFLSFNEIDIEAESAELEELTVAIAEGRKEKSEIADFLRSHQSL